MNQSFNNSVAKAMVDLMAEWATAHHNHRTLGDHEADSSCFEFHMKDKFASFHSWLIRRAHAETQEIQTRKKS